MLYEKKKPADEKPFELVLQHFFFVVFFSRQGVLEKRLALKEEDCQR